MPPFAAVQQQFAVPSVAKGIPAVRSFGNGTTEPSGPLMADEDWTIFGVTRDSAGAVQGNCTVYCFKMNDTSGNGMDGLPVLAAITVSDANGNFVFYVSASGIYWLVDYKTGAPDTGGVSLNNLVGT